MDFDLVLDEIGEFGKFQLKNYILVCLPVFYAAANTLSYVFTARSPSYRCLVPECEKNTETNFNEKWLSNALPGVNSTLTGKFIPDTCTRFNYTATPDDRLVDNNTCLAEWFEPHSNVRCKEWVFDKEERTIVNDWPSDLTCTENLWKLALVGTMNLGGVMVGAGIFGFLADYFGRKKIFIIAILFMSITGCGQAVSNSYPMFITFAFFNAVGASGVYPLAFILGVEMVGKGKREMAGVILNYFFSFGQALVGVLAWVSYDWVNIQYWISAPPILFFVYAWIIPESARWLMAKKRNRKAFKIITKAAINNGVKLSKNIIDNFNNTQNEEEENLREENLAKNKKAVYIELLKSKIMVGRCAILFFIWANNAFVFYGLSLNSVNLSGNIFLNFILVCLIEVPGNTLAWVVMNTLGRKTPLVFSLLICGATCIGGIFVPETIFWLQITLFLIGKMAITSAFTIIFVYSAEMMPTLIRSGGVGFFSTFSRFGALLAPFMPLLKIVYEHLPFLMFGATAFIAGTLANFLPETLGRKLPDTVEEAESIGKHQRVPQRQQQQQ